MAISTLNLKALHLLIERIRRLVDPSAIVVEEQLAEAQRDYEEAIRETNDRLRECDELLREGHRAQALQRCEQDPDLLQVVAVLDLAERPLWHALLVDSGYAPPPTLLLDVAVELNQAYNLEKPLADLMRMHRLHALAGSPLKIRLGFLRKIAQRDADNPIWREDVRLFERSRHLQIEKELALAEQQRDAALAAQLSKEVSDRDWQESPPQPLVETAIRIHTQLRQSRARAKLKELATELHDATGAREESRATQLRQAWNAQVAIAQLPSSDPLFEQVEPVFLWLDREEARRQKDRNHKNAIVALEEALDTGARRIDLERCYNEVTRHGAVPDELDRKVQIRVDLIERRTRMKWRAGVVLGLTVILLAAGGVVWYVQAQKVSQQFARDVAGLAQLVESRNLTEADKYLKVLEEKAPATFASPEIRKLAADLAALKKKEQNRLEAWERTVGSMRAALEDGSLPRLETARGTEVKAASDLSASEVERREVRDLEDRLRVAIDKHQERIDNDFANELRALAEQVKKVTGGNRTRIAELRGEGEALKRRGRVNTALLRQVDPLLAMLDTKTRADATQQAEQEARGKVVQAIGNATAYGESLDAYVKAFSSNARGVHFAKVLTDDMPLLPATELWNRALDKWSSRDFQKISPAEASTLVMELNSLAQAHPGFPAERELRPLEPFLAAVQARVDDAGNRIQREMLAVLDDPRIKNVKVLLRRDGRRQYFERDPVADPLKENHAIFHFFNERTLQQTERESVPVTEINNRPLRAGEAFTEPANAFEWTSPQQRFRKAAIDAVDRCDDTNWEKTFRDLLVGVDVETKMEPTLKLHLKHLILNLGCRGSHCLKLAFDKSLTIIAENPADIEANWLDPADDVGKRARQAAVDTLDRMPDQTAALAETGRYLQQLATGSRGTRYLWVGCVLKVEGGEWRLELPRLPTNATGRLVILRRDAAGAVQSEVVAQAGRQPPVFDGQKSNAFLEGRPVYLATGQ
jgi:hypothetical protein